jgi:hypothetical protein
MNFVKTFMPIEALYMLYLSLSHSNCIARSTQNEEHFLKIIFDIMLFSALFKYTS